MTKLEKVYLVTFIRYTNCLNDTVSDYYEGQPLTETKYLNCGYNFLIKESDIEKYRTFGGGYKSLTYVGDIEV